MKKITLLLAVLLCAALLFAACQENTPGVTVDTTPTGITDPTDPPTVPTEPPTDPTEPPTDPTEPSANPTDPPTEPIIPLPTVPGNPMEYQPGLIQLVAQKSDDYKFERKYRLIYYTIYGEFFALLDEEQSKDLGNWLKKSSEETNYGEFQEEMLLVTMVKRYNIPREEFDKAVEKFIANNEALDWDMKYEEYEVPNADIIYTFDNEIINYYYRYA